VAIVDRHELTYLATIFFILLITLVFRTFLSYYVAAGVVGFYTLEAVMPYAPGWRAWNRTEVLSIGPSITNARSCELFV
jgi:hypothetical protein